MKNKKVFILVISLVLIAVISIATYAIYKSSSKGTSGFKTAGWYIKLNGDYITTSNTFTFDLKDAEWTHNTLITPIDDSVQVIAPGSYGTYGIEIDTEGTEVEVQYNISVVIKQNNTEVDLATINENFTIGIYKDDTVQTNPIVANIEAGEKENLEIRVIWNEVDNNTSNNADMNIENNTFSVEVTVLTYQSPLPTPICIRASELHSTTCNKSGNSECAAVVGEGNTITYGNETTTPKVLKSGDAFDCDLNGDGNYNERFYYVSPTYDLDTNTFDNSKAVLIYYTSMSSDGTTLTVPDHSSSVYDTMIRGNRGPVGLVDKLPTTNQWSNKLIIPPGIRNIKNEIGTTTLDPKGYSGGPFTLPSFDYGNKAARLITAQEVGYACNFTVTSPIVNGKIDNCTYLLENIEIFEDGDYWSERGYWLETPYSGSSGSIFIIDGVGRSANMIADYNDRYTHTVRPVIEVLKTSISY